MSRVFDGTTPDLIGIGTPPSAVYNNLVTETVAFWIFTTGYLNGQVIFQKDPAGPANTPAIIMNSNGSLDAAFTGYDAFSASIAAVLPLNTWTHIAMTYDGSGAGSAPKLYINGTEVSYASQTPAPFSLVDGDDSAGGFHLGENIDETPPNTMSLAEFAVWNVVLTPTQVATLAASTTGAASVAPSSLVGYWHLCGTMSPEPDATGNGNAGVLSTPPPTQGPNSPGFTCPSSSGYAHSYAFMM